MKTKTYWILISILLSAMVLTMYLSTIDNTPISTTNFSPDISWVKTDCNGTHIGFDANHQDLEMICKVIDTEGTSDVGDADDAQENILNVDIEIWACSTNNGVVEWKKGWKSGDRFESCYFVVTIPK